MSLYEQIKEIEAFTRFFTKLGIHILKELCKKIENIICFSPANTFHTQKIENTLY